MSETKTPWTPGPWGDGIHNAVTSGGRTYAHISAPGFLVPVACVPIGVEGYGRAEGEANARLIAEAPEMAELLEQWLAIHAANNGRDFEEQTRALLTRIKGD